MTFVNGLVFDMEQTIPNGTRFVITAGNGRDVEYEIFDYNGFYYFYRKIKNNKKTCSMIGISELAESLQNGIIRLVSVTV